MTRHLSLELQLAGLGAVTITTAGQSSVSLVVRLRPDSRGLPRIINGSARVHTGEHSNTSEPGTRTNGLVIWLGRALGTTLAARQTGVLVETRPLERDRQWVKCLHCCDLFQRRHRNDRKEPVG